MAYTPIPRTCEWCHAPFLANLPKRRFCGKSCSGKARHVAMPDLRQKMHAALERARATPEHQEKMRAYLHSDRNPFRWPSTRAKALLANRAKGFPGLSGAQKGGNGRGPTRPQLALAAALGWPMEVPVSCGKRKAGRPACYKLDIAEAALKIAIEVDGESHRSPAAKARDRRKDAFLASQGWLVLRFKNERVLADLPSVLQEIVNCSTSRRRSETTSQTGSLFTTPTT